MTDYDDMSDKELYRQYQRAKVEGPTTLVDVLQLEIAERWEQELVEAQESGEMFEGERHGDQ